MAASKERRVRVCTRLTVPLRDRLTKFATTSGISERSVIEDALHQYLGGTGDRVLFLNRLDQLASALAEGRRDLEFLSEAFGTHVQLSFAVAPPMLDQEKAEAARKSGEVAYKLFLERVVERFSDGHRLRDALPTPVRMDDGLAAADSGQSGQQ